MRGLGVAGPIVVSAGVRGAYSGSVIPMIIKQELAAASGSHGTGPVCSQVLGHFQVPHGL